MKSRQNGQEIAAFVFDMDGLLVETESIHVRAFEEFMRRRGKALPPGYAAKLVGYSIADNIELLKRDVGLAGDTDALARERSDLYLEMLKTERIEPMPGVRELLDFAERQRMKKAVCSSSERAQLDAILPRMLAALGRRASPEEFFAAVISGDGRARPKPAPDLYVKCAAAMGLEPGRCLAFEDSLAGAQAAAAAGMRVIAVPNLYSRGVAGWPASRVLSSLEKVLSEGVVTAVKGKVFLMD